MLTIRRYQDSDHQSVLELHRIGLQQVDAFVGDGPWDDDLQAIEAIYFENGGEFLVGVYNGLLVAMGALRCTSAERAEIKRMRVRLEYQGRGFGRAILERLELRALELGYTTLHLDTSVGQVAAQQLYYSDGFVETGRTVWQGLDIILFEKSLFAQGGDQLRS